MLKKLVSLLLVALLVLSLGTAALAEEKITLTFLSWHNETTMDPVLEQFRADNPNIAIDLQFAPPVQDYVEKFRMLVASGELPDVFVTAAENKLEVMQNKMAVPLNDLPVMSRLGEANKAAYTDLDGNIVAFTADAWIAGVFYNKDLLDKAGVGVPTNRNEYLASMVALKEAGIDPWVFSSTNLYDPIQGYVATETIAKDRQYDQKVDAGELTYTDGWKTPVELWKADYIDTGYMKQEALGLNGDQAMDAFILGDACYTIGATWSVGTIDEKNPDMNYGMLPFFATNIEEPGWCVGAAGVGWSVNSNAKHPEAAMKLVEYLSSDHAMNIWASKGNLIAIEGIEYDVHPVIAQQISCLKEGRFYLPAVSWKYSDPLGKEMLVGTQNVLAGVIEPSEIVDMLNAKWTEMNEAQQ